ncbi:MAG: hypothetical protein HYW34_00505 [Candidatus Brennerbacteria bacterium]|nr:hypothetical protein [Candidatus Brennerbacteria bacterium]
MKKLFGIVLIILGIVMINYLPEMIIMLWPVNAAEIGTVSTLLLTLIATIPIIMAFGVGLILLL